MKNVTALFAKYASVIIGAIAMLVVSPASAAWIHQPDVPEELMK